MSGFVAGYFVADFRDFSSSPNMQPNRSADSQLHNQNDSNSELLSTLQQNNQRPSQFSALSNLPIEQIKEVLSNTSDQKVDQYLSQAFPNQDLNSIYNKKLFAERLLQELSKEPNLSEQLDGKVIVSTSREFPEQVTRLDQIHPSQVLFAHFDTFNQIPPNSQVFIKWTHIDTNNMILFTPKYISKNSAQNWVSTHPENGWKTGNYIVQIYQMTDQLQPIAHTQFTITSIQQ